MNWGSYASGLLNWKHWKPTRKRFLRPFGGVRHMKRLKELALDWP